MGDEIIEQLEDAHLREEVITTVRSVWSNAGTLYDNPDEDMEEYVERGLGTLWEEAWWRGEILGKAEKVEDAFYKHVIGKMQKPNRLTLQELVEAFWDLTTAHERNYTKFEEFAPEDCHTLYAVFVAFVENHILSYRRSNPFQICLVAESVTDYMRGAIAGVVAAKCQAEGLEVPDLSGEKTQEENTIWERNGMSVQLVRGGYAEPGPRPGDKRLYELLGHINGNMSPLACTKLEVEIPPILHAAVRSMDWLKSQGFSPAYKVVDPDMPIVFEREIDSLPWIAAELTEDARLFMKQYLDAYYTEPSKKDSLVRRIQNAVRLLIESDNQPNNAVGLALSITAIEALLGEKGRDLTKALSENIAVLLEPDLAKRGKACDFVKKLYDIRSRVLHGERIETEGGARSDARHLSAAVLNGVISRRDFLHRAGYDPENPQELLKTLQDGLFEPGQPLGVEDSNVRTLWTK
jgi:hypothetical protein